MITEKEIQERMAAYLGRFFRVQLEVWDNTHKHRIDAVLIHKTDNEGKYPIGVELKRNGKKKGAEIASWLVQGAEYSQAEFTDYGKLCVCIYPQISGVYFEEGRDMTKHDVWAGTNSTGSKGLAYHHNCNGFLKGAFNVGELQEYRTDQKRYYRLVFNTRLLWDEQTDYFNFTNHPGWEE